MQMNLKWQEIKPYEKQNIDVVPNEAGVYIISVLLKDKSYVARYVGQAIDLHSRLLEHLQKDEPNECLRFYVKERNLKVSYAKVEYQKDRDAIELYLFKFFNPKCNINKPPSDYEMKVNLPNIRY